MGINESIIQPQAFEFAARMYKLSKFLVEERKEYVLSKQILRSGTSIGANITEAQYGISRADFRAKMSIALKEAAETEYWLELMHSVDLISDTEFNSLITDLKPIIKMLIKIVNNSN